MVRALSEVRSRYKFVPTLFLIRSFAAATAARPYHPYPAGEYNPPDGIRDAYHSRYDDKYAGYLDWTRRRSYGGEFGGFRYDSPPCWRSYGPYAGRRRVETYPNLGNDLCNLCQEACYWGSDGYAPHWVDGWNGDYRGNMPGSRPYNYGGNFNPDFYQYPRNTGYGYGYFYDDRGRELQRGEHPMRGSAYSPPTYDTKVGGPLMPSSRAHGNNYGMHWNETAARRNMESRDTYGLHEYDQNNQPQRTVDYNRNTVPESGRFGRPDLSFQGQAYPNRLYSEFQSASRVSYGVDQNAVPNVGQRQQNLSSIPNGNGGEIRYERRNESNQPQSYVSESPIRSYSDNKNGFQNISAEHRSSLNYNPEAEKLHFSHNNELKDVLGTPDNKNTASLNSCYKESRDGGRQRDIEEWPQSFTVKKQHDETTDKKGKPFQGPWTYPLASNEAATHPQRQQSQATSSRYTQKTDIIQHQSQRQSPDMDFLGNVEPVKSPTLNAVLSDGGPVVRNSGSQTINQEQEQIRGSMEELETFTKEGKLMLAVKVLDVMEKKKYRLDPDRDLSKIKMLIQACGDSKAITEAKAVHKHIENLMSPLKFSLYNKILGLYMKCGAVSDACSMFYNMAAHNLTSWDTMIKGLVKNNLGEEALVVFAEFKKTDSEPDGPMFLGVFSACRLVGDVIEGMLHFESMTKQYGIIPSNKHYVSIVHMMGHVGHLDEAIEFIEKMPVKPSIDVWETMMNACRIHGNKGLGDRCAEVVRKLDPSGLSDESKAGLMSLIL